MAELKEMIEEMGRTYKAHMDENEKRLAGIEKNGFESAEMAAKLDTISADLTKLEGQKARLDQIEAALNRNELGAGPEDQLKKATAEHCEKFNLWTRKGIDSGLKELQIQAKLSTLADEDGGFLLPEEVDKNITRIMGVDSAMRTLAQVQNVGARTYKKFVSVGGSTAGWVGAEEKGTEKGTPKLKQLEFPVHTIESEPLIAQEMLDDSDFNVEQWLMNELGVEFSEEEADAFINGADVNKPSGLLSYDTVDNASYAWGKLGFTKTGVNGGFHATTAGNNLMDFMATLKSGYHSNSTFIMDGVTLSKVRQIQNSAGDYLLQANFTAGEPPAILGRPFAVDDNMPTMATDSFSLAFGDFRRGYLITQRQGTRVLRDDLTDKPNVKFYSTRRTGGGVQNFEAIKLLKFAA